VVGLFFLGLRAAPAVILFDTSDPSVNTTAPTGNLAGSGWQFQGGWGGNSGTPIAPHFFISAGHIGQADTHFYFQGSTYTIAGSFWEPGSDLLIWRVNETFPSFAPLYSKRDEISRHLVVMGHGTRKGGELMLDGTLRGWLWGLSDGTMRWGENDVADIVPYYGHDLLYATFDEHVQPNDHPNECHLSAGDSGGAIFINDSSDSLWKLAGINYAVDDVYTMPDTGSSLVAAIFDARGYYAYDGTNFTVITGDAPVPTGFYGSRISSELAWIGSVIATPQVGFEANFLTLTYNKLLVPESDLIYTVEQSSDLVSWTTATTQDEPGAVTGDLQVIKAKIAVGTATHLFARLRVTRPAATNNLHLPAAPVKVVPVNN
jgi:hypothetical protein